jgi:CBS domain-containing protein
MDETISLAMPVGVIGHQPICVDRDTTILEVSRLMRKNRVGELVVTEWQNGKPAVAGVLSARDIVTRVVAPELDAAVLTAGDLLWATSAAVKSTDSVSETLQLMHATKSTVIPMTDAEGALTGAVSLDDLLLVAGNQVTMQCRQRN